MRTLVLAAITAAIVSVGGAEASAARLVVDDDGAQCAKADFTRSEVTPDPIQAAVNAAQPGDQVQVCPGRYTESVTVDKPLTLKGDPDALEALDCFDPTPSQLSDLDPERHVIIDGGGSAQQELFRLRADDIVLAGFVLQGASSVPLPLDAHSYRRAIDTSDAYSDYRIHHNLIRLNTLGIQFGSSGSSDSRFDHNCLRENTWGLTVGFDVLGAALLQARIDHNATFKTTERAFEAAPGRVQDVTLDHNVSRLDNNAYLVWNSTATRIVHNTLDSVRIGIEVGSVSPNQDLEISHNQLTNSPRGPALTGIGFSTAPSGARSTRVLVRENTITGHNTGIAIGGPPGASTGSLTDSRFLGNVISDNAQRGIRLRGGNDKLTFRDNVAEGNGFYGIHAECGTVSGRLVCPVDNVFQSNTLLGNGSLLIGGVDARDDAWPSNTWIANRCLTDSPVGTICGLQSLTAGV